MLRKLGEFGMTGALSVSLMAAALAGCSAPQSRGSPPEPSVESPIARAEEADRMLEQARLQALAKHGAVLVLLQADWCQPCNELQFRLLDTNQGKALVDKHVLVTLDFDQPLGGAVASRLHVLGLPTLVVLRAEGNALREYARIEGFDQPDAYRSALTQALERTNPTPQGCANADDRPLDATRPAPLLIADAECRAMQLSTDRGETAAAQLHDFFDDPAQLAKAVVWPQQERERLIAVGQSVGRFDSRVAQNQARGAALFGVLAGWPGTPASALSGLVFWQARCLAKAGDRQGAERVLDAYIAHENASAGARLLAADLMVHEHLAPERSKRLLVDILNADPGDHWAHYLSGELAVQLGDRDSARKHLATANHLRPGVALYIRHYLRLSGDATRVE